MDFCALKLRSTSKNLLENIRWPRNEYEQGFKLHVTILILDV